MKIRIKRIPIALAEAGMKIGAPVCNSQGNILLMAGVELSEAALHSLRRRNIVSISILIEECRSEVELSAERASILDRLNFLFRNAGNDSSLYHLILEYRMEKLI